MTRLRHHRCGDDRGIATLWAVGVITALMVFTLLGGYLACAIIARHRAVGAADLAALAAATQLASDPGNACLRARSITDRWKVDLSSCLIREDDALVEVSVPLSPWFLGFLGPGTVNAHARAGTADKR